MPTRDLFAVANLLVGFGNPVMLLFHFLWDAIKLM